MANTAYGVNDPLAVKLWSKKLFREALKQTWASKFMGKTSNSLCQIAEDTQKGPGDRIRIPLRMLLSGGGIEGDGTLEGNEEALTVYYDDLLINQLRHAVRSEGKMSEQRVPFSVREEARMGLQDWWADRIDTAFFNQLGGNTDQGDTRYTGHNATSAPTTGNIVYINGLSTEAEIASASASNAFTLKIVDMCVERAKTLSPMIRPIRVNGSDKYVMFLHPNQVYDLRTSTTTGQWLDIQKAALSGNGVASNPIYSGALGEYNGVVLHESTRVPLGASQTTVRRAIFAGAQACCLAYGQSAANGSMSWTEELFDYKNQLGVAGGMIWGMKKTVFNSADFSTIIVPTYAENHTS
jgi:N4-gp56 family major capsid protein